MKKYDTLVLIGRFQPLTTAHAELIRRGLSMAKELIILVGSAHKPRSFENPWTFAERKTMIDNYLDVLDKDDLYRCLVHIEPIVDVLYNDTDWIESVQETVTRVRSRNGSIGIIGHNKDESSYYLDCFPQWASENVEKLENLSATDVRKLYFVDDTNMEFIRNVVEDPIFTQLKDWLGSPDWKKIVDERKFVENYKKAFSSLPYPPVFVTVDAVVFQSAHVLMIKRKAMPGKGLWALPGGYLNANTDRSTKSAMIRELREETQLKVPSGILNGSITSYNVFDAIGRDPRGRVITHAFNINLKSGPLEKVKGADDAEKAQWIPLSELNPEECYADHYEIIQYFK